MALQAEVPVGQGIVSLLFQQGDRQEFSLGLAHLAAGGVEVMHMEPVTAPGMAEIAFRLGNLIGMMREGIVHAAAVDVQIFAIIFHGNAGALNMPAGITHTPGRIPFQGLVLKLALGKPEDKVIFVALIGVLLYAFPDRCV